MDGLDVVLKTGVAGEQALAEDAFKGFELHVDALRVILEVRNRLESLVTIAVLAAEGSYTFFVGQQMVLKVLLLLERLVAAFKGALKLALVALEVPVQLALADELLVQADWALEF